MNDLATFPSFPSDLFMALRGRCEQLAEFLVSTEGGGLDGDLLHARPMARAELTELCRIRARYCLSDSTQDQLTLNLVDIAMKFAENRGDQADES